MKKTINGAYELLKYMETNTYQWPKERLAYKQVVRVAYVDVFSNLVTCVTTLLTIVGSTDVIQCNSI